MKNNVLLILFFNLILWITPVESSALTDHDPLTNYSAYGNTLSVIVDMGIPVEVEDIMYIRHGDGNAIMPGDRYEIYYWHNTDWVLHSYHVASDIYLDVCGLLSDGLYFVKGLSRGIQDRIFTVGQKQENYYLVLGNEE